MSRIEQLIGEIEEYIDSCKFSPLSNTKIQVNKEELEELLVELRMRIPDEIKKYQKIISNQDAIISEAKTQADTILAQATEQTNELVNEHEIMQQAYAQANEVVRMATTQAQEILNSATMEANGVRTSAMQYLDDMLSNLESAMTATLTATTEHYESFFNTINGYNEIVKANRAELRPVEVEKMLKEAEGETDPGPELNLM